MTSDCDIIHSCQTKNLHKKKVSELDILMQKKERLPQKL